MKPYKKLEVCNQADAFIKHCYQVTQNFPQDEKYGITSQLRRAAISVMLNIVEGNARGSKADYLRFVYMSRGSLAECGYLLELSRDLGYLAENQYNEIERIRNRTSSLVQQLIKSLR